CVFKDHTVMMCRKFSKEEENVCILSQNAEETISDNNKIKLGTPFGQLNSGYPVYFTKFEIEVIYATALENYRNLSMFAENI
ncbi:14884_t:CDS:2, partial [Cetraspora pellucida]